MISQTVMFGGLDGEGGAEGGGGNSHPGGTIQNCAIRSHELSIVPLGSLQSFLVLLSQYPTSQQNQTEGKAKLYIFCISQLQQIRTEMKLHLPIQQ